MSLTETDRQNTELPGTQFGSHVAEKIFNDEEGQDMVEYGLVIALVVMGAVVALGTFDRKITGALGTLGNAIAGVTNF